MSARQKFRRHELFFETYWFLIQINLIWGLFNLLPIWPLDGGQATQILSRSTTAREARAGATSSRSSSREAWPSWRCPRAATTSFVPSSSPISPMINYQMLQSLHQAHSMGLYQEDEWWRR